MRGIFIDPFTRTIEEVETTGKLPEIYSMLGVELITIVHVGETDVLFLDDEGLFVPAEEQAYFHWTGSAQPFAGKGLIVGTDEEGDSTDAEMDIEEVRKKVTWINRDELDFQPDDFMKVYIMEDGEWKRL
jgi:hypothetical protein